MRQQTPPQAEPAEDSEDEESIDDYMARLLDRMREKNGEDTVRMPAAKPAPARPVVQQPQEKPQAADIKPVEQTPPRPRPQRSIEESRNELRAMRELANLSAQSAITRHTQESLKQNVFSKATVSLVALISAGTLMLCADGIHTLTFYSGLFALVIAMVWGYQFAASGGSLVSTGSTPKQQNAPDASEVEATES